ncbi:MAG TPA: GNAT family N-acetyltransferase [Agromyces sp.]
MSRVGDPATGNVEIERNDEARRYELTVDGAAAGYAAFRTNPGRVTFTHTVVQPEFEGQGLGSRLAKFVLDDAVARGETIVPVCPFIAAYVKRHSDAYAASVSWPENA